MRLAVALLALAVCAGAEPRKKRFRVVTFNVMMGFSRGKAPAHEWLAKQRPDVVALQELKGYTGKLLRTDARAWSHPHVALSREQAGLRLGLTSRTPIEDLHSIVRREIHLGLLHARVSGIDFFVIHLGHGSDERRMEETKAVLAAIGKIASADRPSVLLGDFNSVSRVDRAFYERHDVNGRLYRRNKRGFAILNLDVMDQYLKGGWVDVVHEHQGALTREQASWPSHVFAERRNFVRIDFILASAALAKRCSFARVMKDPATHRLSDHYPVMADFDWPRAP